MGADHGSDGFSDEVKAETRRWLDRWRVVGPLLDDERWARLRARTDDQLQHESWDLLALWHPDARGDGGEGLVILQSFFARRLGSSVNDGSAANR